MFERDVDLLQEMDEATAEMAAASSKLLRAVAEFDERGLWETDGTSMTQWLGFRYCLTWATASEWVRVARALRDLPAIARAYREGRVSWDQLRPLTKFATPETDERLAAEAPRSSAAWLWREAARHQRLDTKDSVEAHRRRYCSMRWNEEKTELYVEAMFPGEQGASFQRAVARRAEQVVVVDDP